MLRSRKFWKGRSWSRIFYLRLRNPGCNEFCPCLSQQFLVQLQQAMQRETNSARQKDMTRLERRDVPKSFCI